MIDCITIGDCGQDVFLQMTKEFAHVHCEHHPERCQLCFNYAEKVPVQAKHATIGGNAANAAVAFARLGLKTAIYTHIGGDEVGESILRQLALNQIVTEYVQRDTETESNYSTIINTFGERTILSYHVPRSYQLPVLPPSRAIYLTSMKDGFEALVPAVAEYVQTQRAHLIYQPGTFQLRAGPGSVQALLPLVRLIIMNKEEAARFLDREPTEDLYSLLKGLLALGVHYAVVTDGRAGVAASDGRQYLHQAVPAGPEPVETTGAGDAFASGMSAALVAGQSLTEALRWGQLEAAAVVQQIGAQAGLLTRVQLDAQLTSSTFAAEPLPPDPHHGT